MPQDLESCGQDWQLARHDRLEAGLLERIAGFDASQQEINARFDAFQQHFNAQFDALQQQVNSRSDRLLLAVLAIGAAQIGLLITLVIQGN